MAKAILVAQFLRARAWWRLDSAGNSALHVARSVVSLLDAAAYLRDIPDSHPELAALAAAGCFQGGVFDPGPEGTVIIRDWQLCDEQCGDPADLLTAMAAAATRTPPPGLRATPAEAGLASPGGYTIPRQAAAPATF